MNRRTIHGPLSRLLEFPHGFPIRAQRARNAIAGWTLLRRGHCPASRCPFEMAPEERGPPRQRLRRHGLSHPAVRDRAPLRPRPRGGAAGPRLESAVFCVTGRAESLGGLRLLRGFGARKRGCGASGSQPVRVRQLRRHPPGSVEPALASSPLKNPRCPRTLFSSSGGTHLAPRGFFNGLLAIPPSLPVHCEVLISVARCADTQRRRGVRRDDGRSPGSPERVSKK